MAIKKIKIKINKHFPFTRKSKVSRAIEILGSHRGKWGTGNSLLSFSMKTCEMGYSVWAGISGLAKSRLLKGKQRKNSLCFGLFFVNGVKPDENVLVGLYGKKQSHMSLGSDTLNNAAVIYLTWVNIWALIHIHLAIACSPLCGGRSTKVLLWYTGI